MDNFAIYQIMGSLGHYRSINYVIEDALRSFKTRFSSLAVYKHLLTKNKMGQIVFVIPHSLFVGKEDLSDAERVEELEADVKIIEKQIVETIQEDLKELDMNFRNCDISFLPIHSIGVYKSNSSSINFHLRSNLGTIESIVFLDMLNKLLSYDVREFYADISTGLNIYTSALLEGLRSINVFYKLMNMLQRENKRNEIITKIVYSEPIIPYQNKSNLSHIYFENIDVKAFFSLPLPIERQNDADITKLFRSLMAINKESPEKISSEPLYKALRNECDIQLKKLHKACVLLFNGIKYNTPLLFFQDPSKLKINKNLLSNTKETINQLKDCLRRILFLRIMEKNNDSIIIKYNQTKYELLKNIFFTLALLNTLSDFYQQTRQKDPTISNIREIFPPIYEKLKLSLNTRFLERDLRNPEELKECSAKEEHKNQQEKEEDKKRSDLKRNFFAHSGLLNNVTCLKNDKLFWREEKLDEIINWIRNPND